MHKILNNNAPVLMKNLIERNVHRKRKITRQDNLIRKPKVKITSMKKAFSWAGPTTWNLLPKYIKNNNLKLFKKELKKMLLETY